MLAPVPSSYARTQLAGSNPTIVGIVIGIGALALASAVVLLGRRGDVDRASHVRKNEAIRKSLPT
jgi:hypothetical protein